MTLSMGARGKLRRMENAALLSPCHTQISHRHAAFCGTR
jgi:hypothetical protein